MEEVLVGLVFEKTFFKVPCKIFHIVSHDINGLENLLLSFNYLLTSPSETVAYIFFTIARKSQNLSDVRSEAILFFISGHSGLLVKARGNIGRFRAIVPLS